MSEEIRKANLSDIKFDRSNANKGSVRGRSMIEASMREFGFADAGTLDRNNTIIGGNKRTEVAGEISLSDEAIIIDVDGTKPVYIRRSDLDLSDPNDDKARKLAYALNRSSEVSLEWDAEQLLSDLNAGVDLSSMFDEDELDALLDGLRDEQEPASDPGAQVDKAAELQAKWQTAAGQLWQLGDHRLICGDCTDADVVARVMGGEKAQLIVTSPPYNQNLDSFKPSGMQKENPAFVNRMANSYMDSLPEPEYQDQQKGLLQTWKQFVTDNASCFYNHKIRYRDKAIVSPLQWLGDCGWAIRQEIIWDRGSSITMNARMFISADERIYWLRVGDDFLFNDTADIKAWTTVWEIAAKNDIAISAAFATEIPLRCVQAASAVGDIVAEPYSGSGTTIIACEQLGRKCRAIEISPAYVAVALQRWADATGQTPVLIA